LFANQGRCCFPCVILKWRSAAKDSQLQYGLSE
jgi:hypothetical protein